jgi:hypothetical protein
MRYRPSQLFWLALQAAIVFGISTCSPRTTRRRPAGHSAFRRPCDRRS